MRPIGTTPGRALGAAVCLAVTALGVGVAAGTAHACSCEESTVGDHAEYTVAAFVGMQIDRTVDDEFSEIGAELTFDVDRVMLGDVTETYQARTGPDSGVCGLDLGRVGQVGLLVFELRDRLIVTQCGSVRQPEELVAFYGEGVDPLPDPSAPPATVSPVDDDGSGPAARIGLIALLSIVVIAGGVVIVRQRRPE